MQEDPKLVAFYTGPGISAEFREVGHSLPRCAAEPHNKVQKLSKTLGLNFVYGSLDKSGEEENRTRP